MDLAWLKQIVWDTPWWVYLALLYLVIAGIRLSRSRIVPFKRLYRLPTILTIISLGDLFRLGGPYQEIAISWCIAAFIGIAFSWWNLNRLEMQLDKENQLVKVPGTWAHLIFLLFIFSAKYYSGYQLLVHPNRIMELPIKFSIAAVLGICAGFYSGILLYGLYYMKRTTTLASLK